MRGLISYEVLTVCGAGHSGDIEVHRFLQEQAKDSLRSYVSKLLRVVGQLSMSTAGVQLA